MMEKYWRNLRPPQPTSKQHRWWLTVTLLLLLKGHLTNMENVQKADENIECPDSSDNSACPCYKFEDGKLISKILFLSSLTSFDLIKALKLRTHDGEI
jgi:hypothetical protein